MSAPRPAAASERLLALLRGELARARRAHWRAALGPALALSAAVLLAAVLILRFALPAGPGAGRAAATATWLLALAPLVAAFVWPWRRLPNARALLREAEAAADTRQLIETAADVAEGRLDGKGYSPALMDRLLAGAVERAAAGLPDPSQGPWPRRGRLALVALVPLVLLAGLPTGRGGLRPLALLLTPGDPEHYAERAWLELLPGDVDLLAGSALTLDLRERDLPWRFPGDLTLEIDATGDLFRPVALTPGASDGAWTLRRESVDQGFAYRARHGRTLSPTYRVNVYHPPMLDSLRVTATAPAYTQLPPRELTLQSGSLRVPEGSRLALSGLASSPLARAWLLGAGPADSLELDVDAGGLRLSGELDVREDAKLRLGMEDRRGTRSVTPTLIELTALPDRAPTVEILAPGPDADLDRDLRQPLEVSAADDYGVAALRLRAVKRGEADSLVTALPLGDAAGQPRASLDWTWDLGARWDLFPGDVVEYWLEVEDTHPGTPGRGMSAVQRLRVPSVAEIYAEIEQEDAQRNDTLEEMVDKGQQLQEQMRKLEEDLRADPDVDWERKQELEKTFENLEQMSEQLRDLNQGLAERSESLSENEMMRQEMADKLEKIQDLMEELRDTEAGDLLRRFQEMLENMNPETLPQELQDIRMDHEALMEQLERTQAMLEQLQRDQKMDALQRQVDEMIQRQQELRAETEALPDSTGAESAEDAAQQSAEAADSTALGEQADAQDGEQQDQQQQGERQDGDTPADEDAQKLAERQEDLAKEAEELLAEIQKTAEEMSDEFPEQAEEMKQSSEPQSQQDPSEPMHEAQGQMEKGDNDEASESQKQAESRLLKLYWTLAQAQSGMNAQMEQRSMESVDRVTRQALELSLREEAHEDETSRLLRSGRRDDGMREAARRQMGLYQSMEHVRDDLVEAGKLTFAVSREAMRQSQAALDAMSRSVAELEAGQHAVGLQQAGLSVTHLNGAVIELLEGVRSQGSGTGSCPNPGAAMQDMLQRQEQLNRDSRGQAKSQGGGGMSMEERAGMARLKAEQQAIREGVQELMNGDQDGLLGRMDKIVEDMKEVEKDLEGGRLDDETLRRQEKIFERLLDAQRSVHRRDFKRERQSETGDELAPLWPEDLKRDDPLAKLRDEIRRGQGEAAPPEYEELIQEYYRSLLERGQGEATP
ncbi:MAG: DUF4175 family protein [Candidatus Krumholzibacteriia bacterium]|nr:DUF4175 family protein [Candidatus Latescibacterota bacterium]